MKWITRERPKIDRIACPWLIKRFVDQEAEFIYVPYDQVRKNQKNLAQYRLMFLMLNIPTTAIAAPLITL